MAILSTNAKPEVLRTLAFGSISGTYANVGSSFDNPLRIVVIKNYTDADMIFSWDDANDNHFLKVNEVLQLEITANNEPADFLAVPRGTQFRVKDNGSAATMGAVYIEAVYS